MRFSPRDYLRLEKVLRLNSRKKSMERLTATNRQYESKCEPVLVSGANRINNAFGCQITKTKGYDVRSLAPATCK